MRAMDADRPREKHGCAGRVLNDNSIPRDAGAQPPARPSGLTHRMVLSAACLIGFCFAFLTAIPSSAWEGPPPARLAPGFSKVDLTKHMEVLEDRDGRLGIDDIIARPDLPFQTINGKDTHIGYTRSAYWVRLVIENTGAQPQDWLLEYAQPYAHTIELFEPGAHGVRRVSTGNSHPYKQRPHDALTFVFPIHQPPGLSTYYLHIASYNRIELLFTAWSLAGC